MLSKYSKIEKITSGINNLINLLCFIGYLILFNFANYSTSGDNPEDAGLSVFVFVILSIYPLIASAILLFINIILQFFKKKQVATAMAIITIISSLVFIVAGIMFLIVFVGPNLIYHVVLAVIHILLNILSIVILLIALIKQRKLNRGLANE